MLVLQVIVTFYLVAMYRNDGDLVKVVSVLGSLYRSKIRKKNQMCHVYIASLETIKFNGG